MIPEPVVTRLETILHPPVVVTDFRKVFGEQRSWATDEEGQILFDHIKNYRIKTVVEIGTSGGFTASCMALAGAKVYTFDVEDRPKIYNKAEFPAPELREKIFFTHVGSPDCFVEMTRPDHSVLWFIDGDHGRHACIRDCADVLNLSRPGDLIFLHDTISYRPVSRTWAEVENKNKGKTTLFRTRNGLGLVCV